MTNTLPQPAAHICKRCGFRTDNPSAMREHILQQMKPSQSLASKTSKIRYCDRCKMWVTTRRSAGGQLYGVSMMDLHICPKCDYATDLMEQPGDCPPEGTR